MLNRTNTSEAIETKTDVVAEAFSLSAEAKQQEKTVLVVGNPNVGKTTLFNALTGENAQVGNYPGVTVERRAARLVNPNPRAARELAQLKLVDVPGAYSLSARSREEQIAIFAALGLGDNVKPDLIVLIVDAGQLVRNLYLALELLELRLPLLLVLNMIDEVDERPPNPTSMSALLGVPCVATNARSGLGIEELKTAIFSALAARPIGRAEVAYSAELRRDVDEVASFLPAAWRRNVESDRGLARWALLSVDYDDELDGIPPALRSAVLEVRAKAGTRDIDQELIATRYAWLDEKAPSFYNAPEQTARPLSLTEKVDRVMLHPAYGFAIFIGVMLLLFQSLFSWADPAITAIEDSASWLQDLIVTYVPASIARDALVEGVIGGVGNVVVFLPQILLLFFFVGLLEDSGYMARVAYLMDRVMRSVGLHGRAFVPMLSGFACAVPAIMATRTMERQRDRLLTMLVVPLMSCSARLPVYSLIIGALFPPSLILGLFPVQGLLMVFMYLFSTITALLAAAVLGRTAVKGVHVPLILELPRYRLPKLSGVLKMMWQRARAFLSEAGSVILVFTLLLWALLSFPRDASAPQGIDGEPAGPSAAQQTEAAPTAEALNVANPAPAIEHSYAGKLGKAIEPILLPLGFDWKIGIGLIGAFSAREVFVSTLGLVYGLDDSVDGDDVSLRSKLLAERDQLGKPAYTPLVGLSLMVFFALACQCMSTLAIVRRETKTWRWPAFMFFYMTGLAYGASFTVFQVGRLLGF